MKLYETFFLFDFEGLNAVMFGIQKMKEKWMAFELPKLPYALDALAPHISKETLEYHYGKHHQAYVKKLNELVSGTEFEGQSLEHIIKKAKGGIFNNAAQVWNHTFYWNCMTPNGAEKPSGKLAKAIDDTFGSFESFKEKFTNAATTQFGSGWAWLTLNKEGKLEVMSTSNAENPMTDHKKPLFTCDVWEHAYYIDTRNDRPKYVNNFWHLAHWDFAEKNFAG